MKRFMNLALTLGIIMMFASPIEAQGQHRRGSSSSTQSAQQSSARQQASSSRQQPSTKQSTSSASDSKSSKATRTSRPSVQTTRRDAGATSTRVNGPNTRVNPQPKDPQHKADQPRPQVREPKRQPKPQPRIGNRPPKHGPGWDRPYLEPRHRPAPAYRLGSHHFGYRIKVLPRGYVERWHNGRRYYYYDGIYYRRYILGGYIVCRPPRGLVIANDMLNVALTVATINAYRDAAQKVREAEELAGYYAAMNADYKARESGVYVTNVADQVNQDYYYDDGVFYIIKNGKYEVIDAPIGALVEQLPEDYEEIELGGETLYQVEDVLYRITIIDGQPMFEVVCNL